MYSAIILAAGVGSRMGLGYNKMLYPIHRKPVVVHTIQKFVSDLNCSQIILVVNSNEIEEMSKLIETNARVQLVSGGAERQDSVYEGLKVVKEKVVLVHDGARPLVSKRMIDECYELGKQGIASVVGVAVKDTMKRINPNKEVIETLNREEIYSIQTPQAAPTMLLKKAHELAKEEGFLGTDESSLIEKYTMTTVQVVNGAYTNIKLTTPEDLILAQQMLENTGGVEK